FPSLPLSYHALASGFLARAVQLLGNHAPAQARSLLRAATNGSWAFASPAGGVGYIGRSQDEAWTLPLTAYGAEVSAAQPGVAGATGAVRLGAGAAEFAAVRRGNVWFAVKRARSEARDLRYDLGLLALLVRAGDGSWRDVLPLRPRVKGARAGAGPFLRIRGR